jgi:H+/Cl- antiporter ClcA
VITWVPPLTLGSGALVGKEGVWISYGVIATQTMFLNNYKKKKTSRYSDGYISKMELKTIVFVFLFTGI